MLPSDLPWVAAMERASFGLEAWDLSMLKDELNGPGRHYFVAEADGEPVGYAGVYVGPDAAEIMTISVDLAHRGLGYGRVLMARLLAEAQAGGVEAVFLEVATDLGPAIGLYESLGFERLGLRKNYYQPSGRDAIVMRLLVDQRDQS
ncbi:MAG: ribosomal protein S18-alanine N-acetyltransferase [Bifidobacteriaceae bacterium]|jgi:ribosomal-protein-alanine N-acetyltransferase|nr:ribosomal protein S18-alanine N-acetyltransferase [Bifidobacteriaceae bacterium]